MTDDVSQMRDPEEGKTPAAWTAAWIVLIAFVIGTVGVCLGQIWLLWVGFAVAALGAVVGKAMSMMGLGQYAKGHRPAA